MKVVLATGIYPPDIGGPATYVAALAGALVEKGVEVVVVTYGEMENGELTLRQAQEENGWKVVGVSKSGGPIARWRRYAKALKEHGNDADVVYAFSSVSCGVPLWISGLKKPKRLLRLGGDFLWERYTAQGGMYGLREWNEKASWQLVISNWLLRQFDHIVFSTEFQQEIYRRHYKKLPKHSIIENALVAPEEEPKFHVKGEPFGLLFMGRFVGFKNIPALLKALAGAGVREPRLQNIRMTLVGDGPEKSHYEKLIEKLHLNGRVIFVSPVHGEAKRGMFDAHDLLVIPSITEISPNVALEARSAGLPVLLTSETGLSDRLTEGMIVRDLLTPDDIGKAIQDAEDDYVQHAEESLKPVTERSWEEIAEEHVSLFQTL